MISSYACRQFFGWLLSPYVFTFLVFTGALLWLIIRGNSRPVIICLSLTWIVIFACSTGWLSKIISVKLERQYPVVARVNPDIRWVVILGGGSLKGVRAPVNYLLTPASIMRLLEGVRLYRQLPNSKLLLSGGNESRDAKTSTAVNMSKLTALFDIPASAWVLEPKTINTAEEVIAIKKRVKDEPFYLVTSALHMPRAMALCHKKGLHAVAAPSNYPYYYDQAGNWKDQFVIDPIYWVFIKHAWHEILGRLWGKLTGLL